jgi:hypothetical protein
LPSSHQSESTVETRNGSGNERNYFKKWKLNGKSNVKRNHAWRLASLPSENLKLNRIVKHTLYYVACELRTEKKYFFSLTTSAVAEEEKYIKVDDSFI